MGEFSAEKLKNYLIEAGEHLKASSLGHRVRCIGHYLSGHMMTCVYINAFLYALGH